MRRASTVEGRGRPAIGIVLVLLASLTTVATASAEECGDADNSGAVTVTDGVQTLRAVAGLSTSCVASRCDVDGSGSVTVTDAVNVLRKAAELPINESCVGSRTQTIAAFIGEMTKIARTAAPRSAAAPALTTECDSGFIEQDGNTTRYVDCRFGTAVLNGSLTTVLVESTNVRFTFDYTYDGFQSQFLDSGFTFRQDGAVRTIIDTEQHVLIEDGSVTIQHSGSASGQEEYTLIKRGLTTDTDTGTVVAGELASALAAAGVIGIRSVTIGFVVGVVVDVAVEFDDGQRADFTYNLETQELTPVMAALDRSRRRDLNHGVLRSVEPRIVA